MLISRYMATMPVHGEAQCMGSGCRCVSSAMMANAGVAAKHSK